MEALKSTATLFILNDVRFFDNSREVVVVPSNYANTYIKSKSYQNIELHEIYDLQAHLDTGRTFSFWSGSIQSIK
jgi:hypothetical protein